MIDPLKKKNDVSDIPVGTASFGTIDKTAGGNTVLTGRTITGIGTPNVQRNFPATDTQVKPPQINQQFVADATTRANAARGQLPGQNTLSPEAMQMRETLYRMQPDTLRRAQERTRVRNMTPMQRDQALSDARLSQRIEGTMTAAETPAAPGERRGRAAPTVDLMDHTGVGIDMLPQDPQFLSPDNRAMQAKGRTAFASELTSAMASTDKTAFQSPEEFNDFVNSLPSVKKYGQLISGTVYAYSHEIMPPDLKAKFELVKQNQNSFASWMADHPGTQDFDKNGITDTAAEIFHAAKRGDAGAADLLRQWKDDPYSQQFVLGPDGKPAEDPRKLAKRAEVVQERADTLAGKRQIALAQETERNRMQLEDERQTLTQKRQLTMLQEREKIRQNNLTTINKDLSGVVDKIATIQEARRIAAMPDADRVAAKISDATFAQAKNLAKTANSQLPILKMEQDRLEKLYQGAGAQQAPADAEPAVQNEDAEGIAWANEHPDDPRAAQIKALAGVTE
jgi:hypothetical protein